MPEISKIVITGGPCAGKSTALSWIQQELSKIGYTVLVIPETATEFISGGVAPWTCGTNVDYQKIQMKLQMKKEELFLIAANTMPKDKIIIVCDRGLLDNRAYMNESEFNEVLEEINDTEASLRDQYDAVFHLVTAANGAEKYYTLENNVARYETVEEAIALDDRIISAWTGHPHFRIIDNSTGFELKMKRLISEILSFIGEPVPVEVYKKFLIKYPNIEMLESIPNCKKIDIYQKYIKITPNEEVRIRQRGIDGSYVYSRTVKRKTADNSMIEIEKRISKGEFIDLFAEHSETDLVVKKDRYCFVYHNQYYEIDIYPFWDDKAILEMEFRDNYHEIEIPPFIEVLSEVTKDEFYQNQKLAIRKK